MSTETSASPQIFVTVALNAWEQWVSRAGKVFESLTDEQMLTEIVPGKNRPIYLLGHLLVVNDALISQLRLGEPDHSNLRDTFITQPDRAVAELPPIAELREAWKTTHARLASLFQQLTPEQWLERHGTISEEDFAKEPHRNRLALLASRTSHAAYHLGQLQLLKK